MTSNQKVIDCNTFRFGMKNVQSGEFIIDKENYALAEIRDSYSAFPEGECFSRYYIISARDIDAFKGDHEKDYDFDNRQYTKSEVFFHKLNIYEQEGADK